MAVLLSLLNTFDVRIPCLEVVKYTEDQEVAPVPESTGPAAAA